MLIHSFLKKVFPNLLKAYIRKIDDGFQSVIRENKQLKERLNVLQHESERWEKNYQHILKTSNEFMRFSIYDTFYKNQQSVNNNSKLDYQNIKNILPNSGSITLNKSYTSAKDIVTEFLSVENRQQDISGFEGFAPDDAIFDPEAQIDEMWSYLSLASILAHLALKKYNNPTFLELGCGASHLSYFLRLYGINSYFGIDGHPEFVSFNPYLKGHEEHFLIQNLQEEIQLQSLGNSVLFDVIISFEVMEHIREDKIDNFIKTLRNHMHQKSILICTASLQELDVHILVKEREWWLNRFKIFSLIPIENDKELVDMVGKCHPFNWKASTTNIFAMKLVN
jgi:2-polyprenyl-3-methyl-5-hydroxy-6-metoxy-1,4-benzoquinol methylase